MRGGRAPGAARGGRWWAGTMRSDWGVKRCGGKGSVWVGDEGEKKREGRGREGSLGTQ